MDVDLDAGLLENDTYRGNDGSPQLAAAAYVENVSVYREAERARRAAGAGESALVSRTAASGGAVHPDEDAFQPADMQATPRDPNRDNGDYVEESDDEFEETAETLAAEAATEAAADVIDITYRDRIFLILQCISVLLHVVVAIWILTSPTDSGIFAQVRRSADSLPIFLSHRRMTNSSDEWFLRHYYLLRLFILSLILWHRSLLLSKNALGITCLWYSVTKI